MVGVLLQNSADVFAGNKVSKVALYLTGVDYADVIALDIDSIANIKTVNTLICISPTLHSSIFSFTSTAVD